jgi:hypothetical protein
LWYVVVVVAKQLQLQLQPVALLIHNATYLGARSSVASYFYAKASYLSGTGELLKLIHICLLNYSYNYNYFNSNYLIRIGLLLLLLLFLFIFIIKAASSMVLIIIGVLAFININQGFD